jgi:hypothetical protein
VVVLESSAKKREELTLASDKEEAPLMRWCGALVFEANYFAASMGAEK